MNCDAAGTARAGVTFVAALALVGCTETSGLDALDDLALRDMAIVAADATVEDVTMWAQPLGFVQGGPASGGPGIGEPGDPGSGRAGGPGPPGGGRGFGGPESSTTTEAFFDAAGNPQSEYDAVTTARIDVITIVAGQVERENWSAVIDRERQITFTGLEGEETHRTANGIGTSEVRRSRHTDDGDRTYDMSGSVTFVDVVAPVPGSDPRWPISGTISRSMTSVRTDVDGSSETREMEMTITFDGDQTAMVVVNGEAMEIDLSAQAGRRPMRGRRGG